MKQTLYLLKQTQDADFADGFKNQTIALYFDLKDAEKQRDYLNEKYQTETHFYEIDEIESDFDFKERGEK